MRVAYYSKYSDRGPSSRFRIFQFAQRFEEAGVELKIHPLLDDVYFQLLRKPGPYPRKVQKTFYISRRFADRYRLLKVDDPDLFVIEHQLFPYVPFRIEEMFLPERYLLEFDDAIYLTHPKKMPSMIRRAAAVIVGNPVLAEYAAKSHRDVHVVPTVLNTDWFEPVPRDDNDRLVIGWVGLEYNFNYLSTIADIIASVLKQYPVEMVILSGSPPENLPFSFTFEKWDPNRENHQINRFDIGLMPLLNDEWSRAKCGMKLLQYMSLKIPAIASRIGVNQEIIEHGVNGFLASTAQDWQNYIVELIQNARLRKTIGEAARKTVVERYSVAKWFPQILEIYRKYANV